MIKKGISYGINKIESSFSTGTLPSYKNPPVNEVVCGLRFDTPEKLRIPHIGFLWDKFRADYPIIQHAPPIAIASAKGEILVDQAIGMPLPRVWFINKSDDQLVQFQLTDFISIGDVDKAITQDMTMSSRILRVC
jgi:hypothetical protein